MDKKRGAGQFRQLCRASFSAVLESHGFVEELLPKTKYVNAYQVIWANETTKVIVEGINWGKAILFKALRKPHTKPDNI